MHFICVQTSAEIDFSSDFQGSGVHQSSVIQGMVFKRYVEGEITKAEKCKIAVYSCPLDVLQTETKVGCGREIIQINVSNALTVVQISFEHTVYFLYVEC